MRKKIHQLVAYQDIPGTGRDVLDCDLALLLFSFASRVLVYLASFCKKTNKKTLTVAHRNTQSFSSSIFYLQYYSAKRSPLPYGVRSGAEKVLFCETLLLGV